MDNSYFQTHPQFAHCRSPRVAIIAPLRTVVSKKQTNINLNLKTCFICSFYFVVLSWSMTLTIPIQPFSCTDTSLR